MLCHVQVKDSEQSALKKAHPWLDFEQKDSIGSTVYSFLIRLAFNPENLPKDETCHKSVTVQMIAIDVYTVF